MKKLLAVAVLAAMALMCGGRASAQLPEGAGYLYRASNYSTWRASVVSGPSASGSGSIVVNPAYVVTGSGQPIMPFNTSTPITVDGDTETPSAVTVGACPNGVSPAYKNCATITATWGAGHTGGLNDVASGDFGIEEAVTNAAANGGGTVFWSVSSPVLSLTGGATTDSGIYIPATYELVGAEAYVETTITTSTSWEIGTTGNLGKICASNSTLSAGTTCSLNSLALVGSGSAALTQVLITNSTTPGAGALKFAAQGFTQVQPAN